MTFWQTLCFWVPKTQTEVVIDPYSWLQSRGDLQHFTGRVFGGTSCREDDLSQGFAKISNKEYLAICSSHFGMADLVTDSYSLAKKACDEVSHKLNLPTVTLFDSGKSFHAYWGLLENTSFIDFCATLLLDTHGVFDTQWIGHSLARKSWMLRISKKYGRLPFLVMSPHHKRARIPPRLVDEASPYFSTDEQPCALSVPYSVAD
jgi:hypothetical protein